MGRREDLSNLLLVLFVCMAFGQDELLRIHVDPETGHFIDSLGRVRIFRGINSVVKGPPWYDTKLLDEERQRDLAQVLGFNVIRLGTMWTGVQPEATDIVNDTYINTLQTMASSLASKGIYSILDMHQDVLWQAGQYDNATGYWGVPPWIKHDLPAPDHYFPWPLNGQMASWACGYFTQEISLGFDQIYRNVSGVVDKLANFWKIIAIQFKEQNNILGYELINEPWAGDIYTSAAALLPGVAGRENLQPLYNTIHEAIRQVDEEAVIFWEPVTWGYVLPVPPNAALDTFLEELFRSFSILDLQDLLGAVCTSNFNPLEMAKALHEILHFLAKLRNVRSSDGKPSVLGPGFSDVPGGSDFRNRTVMSWHYYCWALGEGVPPWDHRPYDPLLKEVCDTLLGPMQFHAVDMRARELSDGGRVATMLTEFGLCTPSANYPDSQNTIECEFVMQQADETLSSWTYWDNWGDSFWGEAENIKEDVAIMFARPFPRATAGMPTKLSFNATTKAFAFEFTASSDPTLATEVFVPRLQYPNGAFTVQVSDNLSWRQAAGDVQTLLFYNSNKNADATSYIHISPTSN